MSTSTSKSTNGSENGIDKFYSTFSMEDVLPSLPLPSLHSTLQKYLESTKPFLDDIEFARTKKIVEDFERGIGAKLHELLSEKARNERNWLEDWWFDWAYLEWRLPMAPWINTAGQYYNQNLFDRTNFKGFSVQNAIASIQLYYTLQFFEEIRNERIPCDRSRNGFLSMVQYKRLFCTCRIPCKGKDRLDVHFRTANEGKCSRNIIILYKNRIFSLDVYHKHDNSLLNISEIYHILNNLVRSYSYKPEGVGIGALTADNRDDWADNRSHLINLHPDNAELLSIIEKSITVLALDDVECHSQDELIRLGLTGNPKNRYFDKSYVIIATKNGNIVVNNEHTAYDGYVSVNLSNYVRLKAIKEKTVFLDKIDSFTIRNNINEVKELNFVYDFKIETSIHKAAKLFQENASISDIVTGNFEFCTKNHIKSYKIHPDTFAQMTMQLAYYLLHQKSPPTYETASTRAYYHGRTETLRVTTLEVCNWVKAMYENKLSKPELLNLLKIAYNKHDKLMAEACDNAGCDRHLLGLTLIAKSMNIDTPEIYKDVAWTKSGGGGNFLISSSCLGFTDTYGGCYAMCKDGYGIFYKISDDSLTFFVSAYNTSKITNAKKMLQSLEVAVKAIQNLYESNSKI